MSEILLNALLHVFALVAGAMDEASRAACRDSVEAYLRAHAGQGLGPYLDLYDAFAEAAEDLDDQARKQAVWDLAEGLRGRLARREQHAAVLQVMALSAGTGPEHDPDHGSGMARAGGIMAAALDIPGDDAEVLRLIAVSAHDPDALDERFLILGREPGQNDRPRLLVRPDFAAGWTVARLAETGDMVLAATGPEPLTVNFEPLPPGRPRILAPGDILRDASGRAVYHAEITAALEGSSGAPPLVFEGRDLDFRFPGSDNGLHHFTFREQTGRMVGIMGGSGAGKTTLLSILSGALRPDSGRVLINGRDLYDEPHALEGVMGLVPQDDLLLGDLTVFQNLYFSARLCMAHLDDQALRERVGLILEELGQDDVRDLKVGSPLDKTISGGQRKRLNIALELIREPAILFADEPTSGLSSADSLNVMSLLKAQAAKGCLVIVVIHQPSSEVFKLFDTLWILDKGGRPVFAGNPVEAVDHFRQAAHMAGGAGAACPGCGSVNPEQIFTILEMKALDGLGRPTGERLTPPGLWHRQYLERAGAGPEPAPGELPRDVPDELRRLHRPGPLGQLAVFFQRNVLARLGNLQYVLINLLEAPLIALVLAFLCRGAPGRVSTFMDNPNIPLFFFMAVIVALFMGLSVSAEEIVRDRLLLKRESFLHLSWASYVNSKVLFLALLTAFQALTFLALGHGLLDIPGMTLKAWAVLFACGMCSCLLGLNISSAFRSAAAIYILIPLLLIPQMLLSGMVLKLDDLAPEDSPDSLVPWYAEIMPSRWGYEALLVEQYASNRWLEPVFDLDCALRQTDYLLDAHIQEMRSLADYMFLPEQAVTDEADNQAKRERNMRILRGETPRLETLTGATFETGTAVLTPEAYDRDAHKAYRAFLNEAAKALRAQRTDVFEQLQAKEDLRRERLGDEGMEALEQQCSNTAVKRAVLSSLALRDLRLGGGRIVQLAVPVCKPPTTSWGRAQFAAGHKRLGSLEIPTYWFNLLVLGAMAAVLYACLLAKALPRAMAALERRR